MDEKNTLKTYIRAKLASGSSIETIKQELVNNGWNEATVSEAIREVAEQSISGSTLQPVADAQVYGVSASENYGVFDAVKDAVDALRVNAIGVGCAMVIGFVVNIVAVFVALVFGLGAVFAVIAASANNSAQPFGTIALLFVVYAIVFSFVSAFTQALVGLTVNDGAEGRKSNIKAVVATALRRTPRVLVATILCTLMAAGPALVALTLMFFLVAAIPSLAIIAYLLALAAVIIGPLIALRLLLMPVAALFETDTPVMGLIGRTFLLMKNGGVYFIVKFFLLVFVIAIVLSVLLPSGEELENASIFTSLATGVIGAVIGALYSAVLVVFYRNRRAVRGEHDHAVR